MILSCTRFFFNGGFGKLRMFLKVHMTKLLSRSLAHPCPSRGETDGGELGTACDTFMLIIRFAGPMFIRKHTVS